MTHIGKIRKIYVFIVFSYVVIYFSYIFPTLRRSIIVQGGLITSTGVVLVVLVLVFVVPGAVLGLITVVARHYGY